MKIIHYSLGFPPYRTGGLTKFCMDLMIQQYRMGHQVALVWPGHISTLNSKTAVKQKKTVTLNNAYIISFEVINPLPISYDEGITDIQVFTQEGDEEPYQKFLEQYRPDVIHIHTLMGLHKSFVRSAKKLGIRIVFTTHDFFPICPKVTMFRDGRNCTSISDCSVCGSCNMTALNMNKIIFLQSDIYRLMKDTCVIRCLRRHHRNNYLNEKNRTEIIVRHAHTAQDYIFLRSHYQSMLQMVDKIHYNSTVAKRVYEHELALPEGVVIPISHLDITDHRAKKDFSSERLRIRYLGSAGCAKGFFMLKDALDSLWEKRRDFRLDVHFSISGAPPYMNEHERYAQKELKNIFNNTDVLVAPSIWNETFGFTVLEALSYGVPVIISDTVGAKDILAHGAGIVIENINVEKLYNVIDNLSTEKLRQMNQIILDKQVIPDMADLALLMQEKCY